MKYKQFFIGMLAGVVLVVAMQTISLPSVKFTVVAEAVDKAMVESISKGTPIIVAGKDVGYVATVNDLPLSGALLTLRVDSRFKSIVGRQSTVKVSKRFEIAGDPCLVLFPIPGDGLRGNDHLRVIPATPTGEMDQNGRLVIHQIAKTIANATLPISETHNNCQWIAQVLKQSETIKVGMTRKDLLKVFKPEGGISTRLKRTYVHKECGNIKVAVEFVPATTPDWQNKTRLLESQNQVEMPDDQIIGISQPFLQGMISD